MTELDSIDRAILRLLQNDGQLTNRQLADEVDLAPSTVLNRVKRLRQEGVLLDTHAAVDPAALGVGMQALISVRLMRHSRHDVEAFHRHALSLEEVLAVYHVTGPKDFVLHLAVRDTDHLRDLAMDAFTTRPEVSHIETALIYESARKSVLPDYL